MKYFSLTEAEKLALNDDTFLRAVKLEGIDRGIKPPITLDEAIRRAEYTGFQIPKDHVVVYEVMRAGNYSSSKTTGLGYLTREKAMAAVEGAVSLEDEGYGATARRKIIEGEFNVQEAWITISKGSQTRTTLAEFFQDDTDWDKLCKECTDDLSVLRQKEYDAKVDAQKMREYLSLANGDEVIAKNFWSKTERREWPAVIALFVILLSLLTGCSNNSSTAYFSPAIDFLFVDNGEALSNAVRFQNPPNGWSVVCDSNGRFCPAYQGEAMDMRIGDWTVRTNRMEAIAAAWRVQRIWDTPSVPRTVPARY